jgi:hypothetical protein
VSQAPNVAESAYPSSFRSTDRNVDSDGGTSRPHRSLRAPRACSASAGTSPVHSAIAVTESACAITANAGRDPVPSPLPALRIGRALHVLQQALVTIEEIWVAHLAQ